MKIAGIVLEPPKPVKFPIPLGDVDVIFTITAVHDEADFLEICPQPVPPTRRYSSGKTEQVFTDPAYLDALEGWGEKQNNWRYLKALEGTEGLEWDTVDMSDPETYGNLTSELLAAGFSSRYIDTLKFRIFEVCGMSQALLDEAMERFLAGRARVVSPA